MILRSKEEREALRECGKRLAAVLSDIVAAAVSGTSTEALDAVAESGIRSMRGEAVFKGYRVPGATRPYPSALCTSVNHEVVHAIPSRNVILKEGDIIGLDIGMRYRGLITDMAVSVPVGRVSSEAKQLLSVTAEALRVGIAAIQAGGHVGDIGEAIETYVRPFGFGIIRELVGHGVGKKLHEDPQIPNFGKRGTGEKLVEGMALALEPMLTMGSPKVRIGGDGWAWETVDGSLAAHFEHTILITKNGAEVITEF